MPPRKKPKNSVATSSSLSNSKKQNQTPTTTTASTPSKFGIQHFFHRHSLSQLSKLQPPSVPKPPSPDRRPDPVPGDGVDGGNHENESDLDRSRRSERSAVVVGRDFCADDVESTNPVADGDGNPRSRPVSQSTPKECVVADAVDCEDVSPILAKSVARKRFKFSPGMLIKQSQEDGGDEITWRISPVNERLHSISKSQPHVVKALAEAARGVSSNLRRCSNDKEGSPRAGKSLALPNGTSLIRATPGEDSAVCNGDNDPIDVKNSGIAHSQSPFRTPPSLPYCHNKLSDSSGDYRNSILQGTLSLRPHKKALLDLLDQVEDVISVEDVQSGHQEVNVSKEVDKTIDREPVSFHKEVIEFRQPKQETTLASSSPCFLVLEVTETHSRSNSSAAQCSTKVLRLLNEHSGKEQSVHLCDGWFYSVISPGDSVRVIGDFDEQGNCYVNHDNNLVIVSPHALISGTRVAASFNCSRRAVLDERLRSSEQSIAALTGTVLHQIFQEGLLMEAPTREMLEGIWPTVLKKNIEALYACGVNEYDMQKQVKEAIPRILNWIQLFRGSKDSPKPTIDFGPDNGQMQVSLSEVVDIEEMVWAPKYGLKGMIDASLLVKVDLTSGI